MKRKQLADVQKASKKRSGKKGFFTLLDQINAPCGVLQCLRETVGGVFDKQIVHLISRLVDPAELFLEEATASFPKLRQGGLTCIDEEYRNNQPVNIRHVRICLFWMMDVQQPNLSDQQYYDEKWFGRKNPPSSDNSGCTLKSRVGLWFSQQTQQFPEDIGSGAFIAAALGCKNAFVPDPPYGSFPHAVVFRPPEIWRTKLHSPDFSLGYSHENVTLRFSSKKDVDHIRCELQAEEAQVQATNSSAHSLLCNMSMFEKSIDVKFLKAYKIRKRFWHMTQETLRGILSRFATELKAHPIVEKRLTMAINLTCCLSCQSFIMDVVQSYCDCVNEFHDDIDGTTGEFEFSDVETMVFDEPTWQVVDACDHAFKYKHRYSKMCGIRRNYAGSQEQDLVSIFIKEAGQLCETPIGFVLLHCFRSADFSPDLIEIFPKFRRRGFGRKVMIMLEQLMVGQLMDLREIRGPDASGNNIFFQKLGYYITRKNREDHAQKFIWTPMPLPID